MLENYRYAPILSIRPSEHTAYTMLSGQDKDIILPVLQIQKWGVSKSLDNTLEKISDIVGKRLYIADLKSPAKILTPADEAVSALKDPSDGFANWVKFLSQNAQAIPVLQLYGSAENVHAQAVSITKMRDVLAVRLARTNEKWAGDLSPLAGVDLSGKEVLLLADYGQLPTRGDLNVCAMSAVDAVEAAAKFLGDATVYASFCGSSFPGDFKGIHHTGAQIEIRERQFHRICSNSTKITTLGLRPLYSDYGSVCLLKRGGGGQGPAPRVDYPTSLNWHFQRREVDPKVDELKTTELCYKAAASAIVAGEFWSPESLTWGAQRIQQAANGNLHNLASPQRWTAVRIHIHLHQQAYYDGEEPPPGEDAWED